MNMTAPMRCSSREVPPAAHPERAGKKMTRPVISRIRNDEANTAWMILGPTL